jgi:hypothetical protein
MKLFWDAASKGKNIRLLCCLFLIIAIQSCATLHPQFGKEALPVKDNFDAPENVSHTFFLIGDAGNWDGPEKPAVFSLLEQQLKKADSASTMLVLGDNVYPDGLPKPGDKNYASAKMKLQKQLELAKAFKGKTIFIPGNHDWDSGIEGLKGEEKLVKEGLGQKKAFLPKNSCGIDHVDINDNTALIVLDSEWYLENWDEHPTINEDCEIKTREMFFKELENKLNDYQNKTVILAVHHPLLSNGVHGGEYSLRQHLYPFKAKIPLPIIGTLVNLLRKTSGISEEDIQNKKYNTFVKRVKTLVQGKKNIIVVSGHEHSLQYIDNENIKQVISGSGSKTEAARAIGKKDFSAGENGFAKLTILKDGAAKVSFFSTGSAKDKDGLLFNAEPIYARPKPEVKEYPTAFAATKDTSVYTQKMAARSGAYSFFWGKHYRQYYSAMVHVPQVSLDTLFGGLTPTKAGGGHQSRSLRLEDRNGKEYVMRALRKSATRFLQSAAFKDQQVEKDFRNTYTESFLMDFYTTAHPYTPFVVTQLSEDLGINHTNPKLFYIPKQNKLGLFNQDFGDELYMVEERPMNKFLNLKSFGEPDKIVDTEDVLANVDKDEKYKVDQQSYIRARMFDMLIGDWDRHSDQWRWGEFKEKGKIIYKPIPRDRDQAFPKIDGALLSILINIPALRHMKKFDEDLKNVKWFNREPFNMDLAFLPEATEKDWVEQAKYIEETLSDAQIDEAFKGLPKEVQDATADDIKRQLKIRKTHLEKYARKYFAVLQRTVLITGTEKNDHFVITRLGKDTKVEIFHAKKDGDEEKIKDRIYHFPETKCLWIYGLGGDDTFEVRGRGKKIRMRLLGGPDMDTYNIESGQKVTIYDFKSKKNDFSKSGSAALKISDDYEVNTYDYEKPKYNVMAGYPLLGYNPDDGFKIGAVWNYTVNGFDRNPYTQKHSVGGNYYFATNGYELFYKGAFPKTIGNWNLLFEARYTSPNFSRNFFGFGNGTANHDDEKGMDYNRVKIRTIKAAPSLQWIGKEGSSAIIEAAFERISVDKTSDRFIAVPGVVHPDVFDFKNFVDLNAEYRFDNYDNVSKPTLGFTFSILGGYKMNVDNSKRNFPYAEGSLGLTYRLVPKGNWVLASYIKGKVLFDNDFEFYQAATVGGDSDLRGFRNQRFAGKRSFYHTTDLRWSIGKIKTSIAPLSYGVLGGFDYGRVWLDDDTSRQWHQSFGGGIWINGLNLVTGRISYFTSDDGGRVFLGLGFGF